MKDIIGEVEKHQKILITTHANPDGDAIGSSLALYGYLKKKFHDVQVMVPDPDPSFLHWMPYHDNLLIFNKARKTCIHVIDQAKLVLSVDYNSFERLEEASELVKKSKAKKILIDHHTAPDPGYDWMISDIKVSSTAELVYNFIVESGDIAMIDADIASCIYSGIITDTGSFSYSCNNEKTYQITAHLISTGIDGEHIHRLIYDTYSEDRLRLLGYSLSDKLVVLPESHTAYISLSREDLKRFNHQVGDTEGIVNFGLSIDGINLAALFMEKEGLVKISFRSKGKFSVNDLARKHFDGGGHNNAAGAYSYLSLQETIIKFLSLLHGYTEQLKKVY